VSPPQAGGERFWDGDGDDNRNRTQRGGIFLYPTYGGLVCRAGASFTKTSQNIHSALTQQTLGFV
jgi:hypothetical protein